MIGAALTLELHALLRSRGRMAAVLIFLGVGVAAIFSGRADVERWRAAIEEGREAQAERIDEARAFLAAGERGPEDRPWVNLSSPRWQDGYAATRIAREPAALAGIAFGAAEDGPLVMRVSARTDPLLATGNSIENPELARSSGLDLVAVLVLLFPLLILALGLDVGGYERSTGLLPLIQVQSGRDLGWIAMRAVAVGILGTLAALFLCGLAVALGGTDGALSLVLLVVAYGAVWTAALAAVAVRARQPAHGAVALGTLWIVVCVVAPAIGVERSAALAADDYGVDLSVEARDASYALGSIEAEEAQTRVFDRFPQLSTSAYATAEEPPEQGARVFGDGLRLLELESRVAARAERDAEQSRLVGALTLASPAVALTVGLENLVGRGAEAAIGFRSAVLNATTHRVELLLEQTLRLEPVGADDFEALVSASPGDYRVRGGGATRELGILAVWAMALGVTVTLARGKRL